MTIPPSPRRANIATRKLEAIISGADIRRICAEAASGAFLAAGTPTVIATLWPVDDAAAVHVTASLYEGLADGLTIDAALERARNECRSTPGLAAPKHWAGFVLVGEGNETIPVRRRAGRWTAAALSGFAALLIYLYYRRD